MSLFFQEIFFWGSERYVVTGKGHGEYHEFYNNPALDRLRRHFETGLGITIDRFTITRIEDRYSSSSTDGPAVYVFLCRKKRPLKVTYYDSHVLYLNRFKNFSPNYDVIGSGSLVMIRGKKLSEDAITSIIVEDLAPNVLASAYVISYVAREYIDKNLPQKNK